MHKSVLLNECLEYLNLNKDSIAIDCTLGYAGHSSKILTIIDNGFLYAFDQDQDAIKYSNEKLKTINSNYEIINSNFVNLKNEMNKRNIEEVDAILFDLGVSSPQLDNVERGFSFHNDAKLDMRMDQTNPLSAYEVVNNYSYEQLINIFYKYGEEKYSSGIAKKIIDYRKNKPITTTLELVDIIKSGVPMKYSMQKHPARKIFQAIRIEVNNELEVFTLALEQALSLLKINGRLVIITFHSLEDKICKQIYKKHCETDKALNNLPIVPVEYLPKYKMIVNLDPTEDEILENKRSRSAKLRVIERIRR